MLKNIEYQFLVINWKINSYYDYQLYAKSKIIENGNYVYQQIYLVFYQMQFPKSTPDLNNPLSNPQRRISRRQSRTPMTPNIMNQIEFQIPNPFLNPDEQQNYLPMNLRPQIQKMEYISSRSIKEIKFENKQTNNHENGAQNVNNGRRVSNSFVKNLQMMQAMARKQEEKYSLMKQGVRQHKSKCKTHGVRFQGVSQFNQGDQRFPMSINMEDDQISLEINGYFNEKERILDDFNMFDEADEISRQQLAVDYYSCHDDNDFRMDEQFDNYLQ